MNRLQKLEITMYNELVILGEGKIPKTSSNKWKQICNPNTVKSNEAVYTFV